MKSGVPAEVRSRENQRWGQSPREDPKEGSGKPKLSQKQGEPEIAVNEQLPGAD